ncbi:ATP-binding cassette domain-containing protein [Bifidobacterium sp. ESL0825]|uniref:ATP-binding cassette domain-containing protein n=1 Tax=Bifidobacterium sp. ESL0825 TaxID=3448587 RepID=UPI004041BE9A
MCLTHWVCCSNKQGHRSQPGSQNIKRGSFSATLFEHFSLTVAEGEKVAIVGESGLGKSALLNVPRLLDSAIRALMRCWADPRALCQCSCSQTE